MKRYFPILILAACAGLFVFGLAQLFNLRFAAGDVYPSYSTLRADPLGTMAFYESLEKVPGLTVRRDLSTANRLPEEPGTVYFHLAAKPNEWEWMPDDALREIRNFMARGGRIVIAFAPQTSRPYRFFPDEDRTNSVQSAGAKRMKRDRGSGESEFWISLGDNAGFYAGFEKLDAEDGVYQPVRVENRGDAALPRTLEWHSGLIFTNCDEGWRTIYARGTEPVVIERQFGKGSAVIASDSFFISNEAMSRNRHADLLAWLIGPNHRVVFDEAHLGIHEGPGVASLMRKYRLHGLGAGLLLVAALFIWKNSTSLAPRFDERAAEDVITGKDAASGFVNLLRRGVPGRDVFAVCFEEWKKSARAGKLPEERVKQAEAVFASEISQPSGNRNPTAAYRRITEILGRQNSKL